MSVNEVLVLYTHHRITANRLCARREFMIRNQDHRTWMPDVTIFVRRSSRVCQSSICKSMQHSSLVLVHFLLCSQTRSMISPPELAQTSAPESITVSIQTSLSMKAWQTTDEPKTTDSDGFRLFFIYRSTSTRTLLTPASKCDIECKQRNER